ncbi:hypothetical protein Vi05172_g10669 [Venturia inaequalis]|nr:hypothetical protein Vi05172_g10669 [Venturia inaequalis]
MKMFIAPSHQGCSTSTSTQHPSAQVYNFEMALFSCQLSYKTEHTLVAIGISSATSRKQ